MNHYAVEGTEGPNIRTKYQKLLEAYQRCKKETTLLKKALIADQETHAFHENVIKEKEVLLRSSVEENDMLTFNNQRLTKRVEQLVVGLHEEQNNAGRGWGSFFSGSKSEITRLNLDLDVAKEQLGQKLEENEGLVSQMCELRSENEQTVAMLNKKLTEFKKTVKAKEEELDDAIVKNDDTQDELNDQKNALNQRLALMERELEQTRTLMQEREQTMTTINRQLSSDLERTQHLFDHKVSFDDTKVSEYNKMNIPGFDRVLMLRKIELAEQAHSLFETFSRTFRDHDQALGERLNLMGRNLSAMSKLQRVNEKISRLLPEHQAHLRNLEQEVKNTVMHMKSVLDVRLAEQLEQDGEGGGSNAGKLAALFKRFVFYHNKMLPYQVLSLMEEARKDTCVPVLQARNYVLVSTQKRLTAALDKLCVYVQLACPGSTSRYSRAQEANAPTILKYSHSAATAMLQAFQGYATHLISKISQEHRAPFVLPELKMVNEKVLQALSTLVTTIAKLVELLGDFVHISSTPAGYTIRGVECDPLQMSEDIPFMRNRARKFVSLVHKGGGRAVARVPYSEAVRAQSELAVVDEIRDSLKQEIDEAKASWRAAEDRCTQVQTRLDEQEKQNSLMQAEIKSLTQAMHDAEMAQTQADQLATSALDDEIQGFMEAEEEGAAPEQRLSVQDERRSSGAEQTEIIALRAMLAQRDDEFAKMREELLAYEQINSGSPTEGEADDRVNELKRTADKLKKQRDEALAKCKEETAQHNKALALLRVDNTKQMKANEISMSVCSSSMLDEIERQLNEHHDCPKVLEKPIVGGKDAYTLTMTDENGRRVEPLLLSGDRRDREQRLQTYYKAKLCQLVSQVKVADEVALEWHQDHEIMKSRFAKLESQVGQLQKELQQAKGTVQARDAELATTKANYEKQIKTLTEKVGHQRKKK